MKKRITYWLLLCMSLLASKLMAADESSSPDPPLFGNEDSSSESEKPLKRIKKRQIQRKRKKTAKITFSDKPDYDPFVIKSAWEQDTEDEEAQGTPPPPPRSPSLLDSTIEQPNNNEEQRLLRVAQQLSGLRINDVPKNDPLHINDKRELTLNDKVFDVATSGILIWSLANLGIIAISGPVYPFVSVLSVVGLTRIAGVKVLNGVPILINETEKLLSKKIIKNFKDKAIQETENAAMAAPVVATLGPAGGVAAYAGAKAAQEVIDGLERTERYQSAQKKIESFDNMWSVAWLEDLEKKFQEDANIPDQEKKEIQTRIETAKAKGQQIKKKDQLFATKKAAYRDFVDVVFDIKKKVNELNKQGHQVTFNDPKLPTLPDLTMTEDWLYYVVNKCKQHRRKIKLGGATAAVGLYYLALPYAAAFPRTSMLIVGTVVSAYVGKMFSGTYLNVYTFIFVILSMIGLYTLLFQEKLPKAVQQEEVKELVEAIKDEIVEAAAKAPIKPPKRFIPAPAKTKRSGDNKLPSNQGVQHPLLLIVLLGLLLGTFVFFVEKQRYKRRSKRRLGR